MFGKVFSWVRGKMGMAVAAVTVGVAVLTSGEVFAQAQNITVEAPNINWATLPSTILGVLTPPIVVGIGIAFSIWAVLKAISFFKRSST